MRIQFIFMFLAFVPMWWASAQVSVPSGYLQPLDILNDSTTLALHSSVNSSTEDAFELLNPQARISFNNTYPRGFNDGPVWKGKGFTTEAHFGFTGKIKALSYTFYPVVYYSQNRGALRTPVNPRGNYPYGYQFQVGGGIDFVQRYGSDPFTKFHLGQSEVRLQFGKFISAVSTQNYSVGPSVFNPIILSRQGEGFPHLRLGTEPLDLQIKDIEFGRLEANFIVGYLRESDYFDDDSDNDNSYFNALFLAYTPPFLKNLTLGFNKSLYKQTNRFSSQDLVSVIHVLDTVGPNDQFDQLASATAEWRFPDHGFRAYAEFAYNDFGGAYKWIEPEHSRAYTIGFEKESKFKNGHSLNVIYEHTNLSRNHTYLWRATPPFYIHSVNRQGYTNRGQLLGAGIGPGSNSDIVLFRYQLSRHNIGLSGQRIEYNKDYFVTNIADRRSHNIEYSLGGSYQYEFDKVTLRAELVRSKSNNVYYELFVDQQNFYLSISAKAKL
ncbi:hypothetical protein [Marinoscillum sp.]|uniref:hypothetical protein n=1 Tax=Marinoscillum sp. TaxID=2024838 RepID=UPI003BAA8DAB